MDENEKQRLLRERASKKKSFERQNSHKHDRVPSSWRKARGTHSPVRLGEKHARDSPGKGHRSPTKVRGLHPSGYEDILVHRPADLEDLDPETDAARIASKVGGRKREQILEKAAEDGIKVLNAEREDASEGDDE